MESAAEPYRSYSQYLRERYGTTVYRVAVDAGFSCPHRGVDRRNPGCTYCAPDGGRAPYLGGKAGPAIIDEEKLMEQIRGALAFLAKRYNAKEFILYFQAYSNTFAPVADLKRIFDAGLSATDFRELAVSTRPDCIDAEKARLLSSYRTGRRDVWVELGLQSFRDETLLRINRAHSPADFLSAYRLLKAENLKVCVHLIFGLPGERKAQILDTMSRLAALRPDGIKIHNLHVVAGTRLAQQYAQGEITLMSAEEHLECVIASLEMLPAETVVMRLTCDTPADRLVAPRDFPPKQQFLRRLKAEMARRNTRQGKKTSTSS